MEELNLQALEQEYTDLKGTISSLKGEVTKAQTTLSAAEGEARTAENNYQAAKSQYDMLNEIYQKNIASIKREDGTYVMPINTYDNVKDQVDALRTQMEQAEETKREKDRAVEIAREAFTRIKEAAQQADSRMNLILASFGANEKINKALVNELENDYADKIDGVEETKSALDNLKTKINDDEFLKKLLYGDKESNIEGLQPLLTRFEELNGNGPSVELGEVNQKLMDAYANINARLKNLGLDGADISYAEINKMLTEKDPQGRMAVYEIDRRVEAENRRIQSLETERDSIIEVMNLTLEMAKDPVNGTPELQALLEEVSKLQTIVNDAQRDFNQSRDALQGIERQKVELANEIERLKKANPDYEEILRLQAELAGVGDAGKIPNPKHKELKDQIEELTRQLNDKTQIDNPDYIAQQAVVTVAKNALEAEENNPTQVEEEPGDVIQDNPAYIMAQEGVSRTDENYKQYRTAHPEIADLYDGIKLTEVSKANAKNQVDECKGKEDEAFKELAEKYVSSSVFEDLKNPETDASKAFEIYRAAELAVRKAMLEFQKAPTDENKTKLESAMNEYNSKAEAFKTALKDSVKGKCELPSTEAIHNYLLSVLNRENPKDLDPAYNVKSAENRIALVEKQYKRTDIADLAANLRVTSGDLDKILPMLLSGEAELDGALGVAALSAHAEAVSKFGDEKGNVLDTLNGTGSIVNSKDLKWWQRIFAMMPKEKQAYDFKSLTKPETYKKWDAAKLATKEALDAEQAEIEKLNGLIKGMTDEERAQYEQLERLEGAVADAENTLNNTPKKLNKSKADRLRNALQQEQNKLNGIPAKKDAIDKSGIPGKIAALKQQLDATPEFTGDSTEVETKKNRLKSLETKNPSVQSIVEAENKMKALLANEKTETDKKDAADKILRENKPVLNGKLSRLKLLQKIKDKFKNVTNLIKIKDAGKISDNRAPIARTIADDTKATAKEDLEMDLDL